MTTEERVAKFNPDHLLVKDGRHYMVKGDEKVFIHEKTFESVKAKYEVREG